MAQTLLVNKTDFGDVAIVNYDLGDLADGCIRVAPGPFALTANNITYMVTGDMIGYWNFFDPDAYGIGMDGHGRMPVWGYAEVTESRCDGIDAGEIIYGFYPIATAFDMKPANISNGGFVDAMDHRVELHVIYNTYVRTGSDPSFVPELHEIQPILRPLFTTSFLIDDQFGDENFYGADQIVLLSASSKTALGTAYCLKERGGVKVTGLTSAGNKAFVESTGFYDAVVAYDDIASMDGSVESAIIDMAGNGAVTGALYDRFEDNIVYNCMVGKSHWQGAPPKRPAKGAPPAMFFAPDRAKIRLAEWGGKGFALNLAARWVPFCQSAASWLSVETKSGIEGMLPLYKDMLSGQSDPSKGYLITL